MENKNITGLGFSEVLFLIDFLIRERNQNEKLIKEINDYRSRCERQ